MSNVMVRLSVTFVVAFVYAIIVTVVAASNHRLDWMLLGFLGAALLGVVLSIWTCRAVWPNP